MARIEKLGNVYYSYPNTEEAARFFENVLQLPLKFRDGDRWIAFDLAGTTFAVAKQGDGAPAEGAGAMLSLKTDDLDGMVAELRGRGATVSDPRDAHHERTALLSAPGGHTIVLYEPLRR
jgi:predicted enzyme related to lactoylglutathione lyase